MAEESAPFTPTDHFRNLSDRISAYRGNPLIGALGYIRTKDQIIRLLSRNPPYDPTDKNLPAHLLPHAAAAIRKFFAPTLHQIATVQEIDLSIRQSYAVRNPLDPSYRNIAASDLALLNSEQLPPNRFLMVPQLGAAVTGPSGTGKTITVDFAISEWPQVIGHRYRIDGKPVSFIQVPYLKLDLFPGGSLKAFGTEIFNKLDAAVGGSISREWGAKRASSAGIQHLYYKACMQYNVGMLIFDEFQFIKTNHEGAQAALGYFVSIMNSLGIAVVVIGTQTTQNLLAKDESIARRFVSSIPRYSPFTEGKVWKAFSSSLLQLLYVEHVAPIGELQDAILEASGGIPDLAVKIFYLSQMRLFGRKENNRLSKEVIKSTADILFYGVNNRIHEIKGATTDTSGLENILRKINETLASVATVEASRVGATTEESSNAKSAPIEVTATDPVTVGISSAAETGDVVGALEKMGLLEGKQ